VDILLEKRKFRQKRGFRIPFPPDKKIPAETDTEFLVDTLCALLIELLNRSTIVFENDPLFLSILKNNSFYKNNK